VVGAAPLPMAIGTNSVVAASRWPRCSRVLTSSQALRRAADQEALVSFICVHPRRELRPGRSSPLRPSFLETQLGFWAKMDCDDLVVRL
jgi:hypothetical protein